MPDTALSLPVHRPQQRLRWPAEAGLAMLGLLCACGAAVVAIQGQGVVGVLLAGLLALAGGALAGVAWSRHRLAAAVAGLLQDALQPMLHPAPARPGSARHPLASGADGAGLPLPSHLLTPPPAPGLAVLRPLADGLQQLLQRQQALFNAQAEQLEALRQRAHNDGLTGLANRRHFMATLDGFLAADGAPAGAGLLLLRVCDLQGMNQRIGPAATDQVLQALAQALQAYPDRIERCAAGRLGGADFALLLPVGGMAAETAASLLQVLHRPVQRIDAAARLVASGVELRSPLNAAQALALADAALASLLAGSGGGSGGAAAADGLVILPGPAMPSCTPSATTPVKTSATPSTTPPDAARADATWQRRIARALVQGRVALGEFAVCTADGRLLHLDCPLRVQLLTDGPLEPAARWLSLATRSRLCAAADERALALALTAIAGDGVARCINVAAQSAASAEFVAAATRRLAAEPELACRLWIDLPEALALDQPLLVRALSRRWRPLGVMLGLEHAGHGLARIPQLIDLGLDCVRIDSRFVNGIAGPRAAAARRHLQSLVKLVQTVGLQVTAEGVRSADDLALLWSLGFDAATGPVLSSAPAGPAGWAVAAVPAVSAVAG